MRKLNTITICLILVTGAGLCPLYAMNAISPTGRDATIDTTMNGLNNAGQPTELEPIKINVREIQEPLQGSEYLLARALYLYNQRRLHDAKGDLKEILIDHPNNQTASKYLTDITSKIEAESPPKKVVEEELKGIASVDSAHSGGIYGREEFGNTDGAERFTSNTVAIATKISQQGADTSNKFISEAMKLEGSMSDYKYTATANVNYYNRNNTSEDKRLRNATWWMKNEKVQFILGDTSSLLSRYVLNGVNYRGANLKLNMYQDTTADITDNITFLYGKVPYFQLTQDEYIYPRDIAAVRNELTLWGWWDLNTSFAYIVDNSSRIAKIDVNDKAKQNALLGVNQVFRLMPGVWTLYHETAFSYADDDRAVDNKILRSDANYLVSDFKTKTVKVYNSYERIEPNFRSYVGLTGFSSNNQVTINREHILNFIDYMPYDEVDLGLQYSRTRTNLDKKYDVETIKEENYKANLRVTPKNGLPRFSLRGSIWTANSTPGENESPKDEVSWDSCFEMAKTINGTDWSTSYGARHYSQFINATNTYGDAIEHVFTLSANRKFLDDRIEVTPSYSLSRASLIKKPNRPIYTETIMSHLFDLSTAFALWDTAHLTFDYNLSSTEDFATSSVWGTNNAFTTTFSWPFTTTLGFRKKLVLSPFISYHYSTGTATFLDRRYFSTRLEGDYCLTQNSKLNLSGEYRDNVVNDPTYCGFGDEYRIMLSYKTVNGF